MRVDWVAGGERVKYVVVIECSPNNYAAYVPDLPGCVATGDTLEEVERNIGAAIEWHLEGLREEHVPIPEPQTTAKLVEV